MYSKTREETATLLNISTRSVDRYIRSWKLRSKKIWKIVYINDSDIDNFLWNNKQEVILLKNKEQILSDSQEVVSKDIISSPDKDFLKVYNDFKEELNIKNEEIRNMSMQIWKLQEIISNSIPIIEYKKEQFLIQESKTVLDSQISNLKKDLEVKDIIIKSEKRNNYILLWVILILFILLFVLWFVRI